MARPRSHRAGKRHFGASLRGWATYFRHAVAKRVFGHIDQYAWRRLAKWLRCKHRIGWKQLRRRFCDRG